MKKIEITSRKLFYAMIITGVIYFTSQAAIINILHPIGTDAFMRFQLTFSGESMAAILNSWGEAGIETLFKHFYLDFLHPLWYSAFLFFSMIYVKTKLSDYKQFSSVPKYVFLPFIAAFADLAENFMEIQLISTRFDLNKTLVMATGIVSLIKWLLVLVSIIIIVALLVKLVLNIVTKSRT
ncbi:MAG: hypothetical protein JXA07_13860 [Spirochaetes bacterium]|nr:hypothetical protein [Spirochaetota bacterium]